jgi:hypothetical protein
MPNIDTDDIMNKVTCCDMNGKVQWEFHDKNVLESPQRTRCFMPNIDTAMVLLSIHVTSHARPNLMSIVKSIDPSLCNTTTSAV